MTIIARIFWIGITLLVIVLLSLSSYHATDSTEVGVRTVKWLGKKGVEDHAYQPGAAYFFLPIFNAWDTFDTRLQVIELSLIHISEPTRLLSISYAVFCLKK